MFIVFPTMTSNLVQIQRRRERLSQELASIRGSSLHASRNGDFRTVARLTLKAAEINRSIVETDVEAELTR
jgi:hypothetical protein